MKAIVRWIPLPSSYVLSFLFFREVHWRTGRALQMAFHRKKSSNSIIQLILLLIKLFSRGFSRDYRTTCYSSIMTVLVARSIMHIFRLVLFLDFISSPSVVGMIHLVVHKEAKHPEKAATNGQADCAIHFTRMECISVCCWLEQLPMKSVCLNSSRFVPGLLLCKYFLTILILSSLPFTIWEFTQANHLF